MHYELGDVLEYVTAFTLLARGARFREMDNAGRPTVQRRDAWEGEALRGALALHRAEAGHHPLHLVHHLAGRGSEARDTGR